VPTNRAIDDKLLATPSRVRGRRIKRKTIDLASADHVQRRERLRFVRLFGTVDFRTDWDYKKRRR
jgi:hypothetical protein